MTQIGTPFILVCDPELDNMALEQDFVGTVKELSSTMEVVKDQRNEVKFCQFLLFIPSRLSFYEINYVCIPEITWIISET